MNFNQPNEGTYVQDNSINNNFGTNVGATTYNTSCDSPAGGNCYTFDGTNDYIDMGDTLDILTNDLTISAWVNPNNYDDWNIIVGKSDGSYGYNTMIEKTTGNLRVRLDNTVVGDLGTDQVPLDEWSLVTIVFDRDDVATGYINGVAVGTLDITGEQASIDVAHTLKIGATGGTYFDGQLTKS